jgi:hypothetical protein
MRLFLRTCQQLGSKFLASDAAHIRGFQTIPVIDVGALVQPGQVC